MKRLALVILFAGMLIACSKKTPSFDNSKNFSASLQTQANDEIRLSAELDAAFNDVDSALGNGDSVCGGSIAIDSVDTPRSITINYSGNTCNALRNRTGAIAITYTPGTSWNSPGDSVIVNFRTLVITRLADSKTLTLAGTFAYVNSSGGSLSGLHSGGTSPVIHTLAGSGINITYDDGTLSYWRFNRRRTYTYSSGLLIATIGLDSAGSIGGVADWGGNRFGNSVVTAPTTPLQLSQACGWETTAGQATMTNPIGVTTLNFGLDTTGKATGCPVNGGHFYYKLAWTGDGENPYTAVLPY
jgi:hypothetical protein